MASGGLHILKAPIENIGTHGKAWHQNNVTLPNDHERRERERDGIGAPYLPIMKLPYYTTPTPTLHNKQITSPKTNISLSLSLSSV